MAILSNFPAAGIDTSDATATAADLLQGKTAYGADGKIIGKLIQSTPWTKSAMGSVYNNGTKTMSITDLSFKPRALFIYTGYQQSTTIVGRVLWDVNGSLIIKSSGSNDITSLPTVVYTDNSVTITFSGSYTFMNNTYNYGIWGEE